MLNFTRWHCTESLPWRTFATSKLGYISEKYLQNKDFLYKNATITKICGNFVPISRIEYGKKAEFIHLVSQYKGAG